MLRSGIFAASLTVLATGCGTARPAGGSLAPATASAPASAWTLAWSDEFDGPAGALVDSTRWVAEVGGHGWVHGPGYSGGDSLSAGFALPGGEALADGFHLFAVEWEPAIVRFSIDGNLYETRTPADLRPGQVWVFDHPFFMLLNVAVGG